MAKRRSTTARITGSNLFRYGVPLAIGAGLAWYLWPKTTPAPATVQIPPQPQPQARPATKPAAQPSLPGDQRPLDQRPELEQVGPLADRGDSFVDKPFFGV